MPNSKVFLAILLFVLLLGGVFLGVTLNPILTARASGLSSNTLADTFGFQGQFTPVNDLRVAVPYKLVGTTFGAAIDTQFWTASNSGAGSAAGVATGLATLTSGTANNGNGQIITVRSARYMFVHPHLARMGVRIPALGATLCTRRWGAYTISGVAPVDGFFFSFSGTNVLSVNSANAGVVTSVSSGSFNGFTASYTVDTNVHFYQIIFGEAEANFYVDGVLLHRLTPTTTLLSATNDLFLVASAVNSAAGVTSGTVELWGGSIMRLGREESAPRFAHITAAGTNVLKLGSGRLQRISVNNASGTLITVVDNTSGVTPVIAVINTVAAGSGPYEYQLDFQTGLIVITTGTWDLTVIYE